MSRSSAATDVFTAIADPTRRRLLDLLGRGELSVMGLTGHFDMTVSAVSQHLRLLREVGLVEVRRAGRERYYRLDPGPLKAVADWIGFYEQFWRRKLRSLDTYLDENP
jgi:DNA-binding transcriptional ArsR family regulator